MNPNHIYQVQGMILKLNRHYSKRIRAICRRERFHTLEIVKGASLIMLVNPGWSVHTDKFIRRLLKIKAVSILQQEQTK